MGPKTNELIDVLGEIEVLLSEQEENLWEEWMAEAKKRLLASDYSGIKKLLGAYGGMGSFNDLVVGYDQVGGVTQQRKGYGLANKNLSKLSTRA